MNKIKNNILSALNELINPKKSYWVIITLFFIGITLFFSFQSPELVESNQKNASPTIDTFVPNGFVLVSLNLVNNDSIDSMVGPFTMVDLYPTQASSQTEYTYFSEKRPLNKPIATRLRLIRSPNNPNLFGVLVPESHQEIIQRLTEPVFAVIQGPNKKINLNHKTSQTRIIKRKIMYGDVL